MNKHKKTLLLTVSKLLIISLLIAGFFTGITKVYSDSPKKQSEISASTNKETEFIKDISWRPFSTSISTNTPIKFVVQPGTAKLNELEFQLWEKPHGEDWKIVVPYGKLPFKEVLDIWESEQYFINTTGQTDIQIDIRMKGKADVVQKKWLGQFYVNDSKLTANSDNLIRQLLGYYSPTNINDPNELYEPISKDILLSVYMLYWQFSGSDLDVREKDLSKIPGVGFSNNGNGKFSVAYKNSNGAREIDLVNFTIQSNGMTLKIDLKNHKSVNDIFTLSENLPEKIRIASAINYLLYCNYEYSTVPFEFDRPQVPLFDRVAHCGNYSTDLFYIMKYLDYQVCIANIHYGSDAVHAVCLIKVDNKIITLDPTSGVIYNGSIQNIVNRKAAPIVMPQVRDLSVLWSRSLWDSYKSTYVSEKFGNWENGEN